jgi:predicted RNase H-like nuclease (RuvC/YqgF family)
MDDPRPLTTEKLVMIREKISVDVDRQKVLVLQVEQRLKDVENEISRRCMDTTNDVQTVRTEVEMMKREMETMKREMEMMKRNMEMMMGKGEELRTKIVIALEVRYPSLNLC